METVNFKNLNYRKDFLSVDKLTAISSEGDIFEVGDVSLETIINELKPTMFKLNNYNSYPHIKVEMLSQNKK